MSTDSECEWDIVQTEDEQRVHALEIRVANLTVENLTLKSRLSTTTMKAKRCPPPAVRPSKVVSRTVDGLKFTAEWLRKERDANRKRISDLESRLRELTQKNKQGTRRCH